MGFGLLDKAMGSDEFQKFIETKFGKKLEAAAEATLALTAELKDFHSDIKGLRASLEKVASELQTLRK